MKIVKIIIPIAAAAAAGAAALIVKKKKPAGTSAAAPGKKAPVKITNPKEGNYSFVSGYKDTQTVNVDFTYDADKYSFKVIEDEFLAYTSDSHVAAIYGDDFNVQIEYADFYPGDNFEKLASGLREKYKGFAPVSYGPNSGYKYYDGDNVCVCLPATEFSYILVTIIKGKAYDDDFTTLTEHPDIEALLSSVKVS